MYAVVSYELPVGSTLSKTIQKTAEIESIVATLPESEMRNFVTTIGEKSPLISSRGQDLNSENVGNIVIHLTEIGSRDRRVTDIIVDLRSRLSQLTGFKNIEVDKIAEGPPVGRAVTVTIISDDDADRNAVVSSLMTYLRSIPNLHNIESNETEGKKKLMIDFNYDRLARLGITASQVSQTLRMAYSGRIVTSVRRGGEDIDYRVQLDDAFQNELLDLKQLKVINNNGKLVPIQNVIRITETTDVLEYHHYDGDRAVTVFADIDPLVTDTALNTALKVNRNVISYIQPLVDQYSNMRLEIGGEEKDSQDAMKSLVIAMALALIGIYFVLVILFDSFSQPLLVMIAIPFSFSGIVYTFFFHQMVFGFMAILGLIGLTGIVVNDSLILISMINKQVAQDGEVSVETIARASESRLRPIFLTTITTAAGLLPTAYGFGGNNPFLVPMIMSVAWGLIFATVITLFLIPALYLLLHRISKSSIALFIVQFKRNATT
jgi:multidrug efflux pump subunit AcrB